MLQSMRSLSLLIHAFIIIFFILASGLTQNSRAVEPTPLDLNRYMEGKYVFERHCIVCHGSRGDGAGEMSATLQPKPRSFREGFFKFRSTPYGMLPTEADLARTIRGGLSGTGMGMFSHLSDTEVRSVIEYVKTFSRRWKKPENYGDEMKLPPPPPWMEKRSEMIKHVSKGQELFRIQCAACHGLKADGQGAAGAVLVDIWNLPSRPSDLRQAHLRCGDTPADVYRVLATGLNGTPMISFEATLTPEQRWDIIAYLLTLKFPSVPTLGVAPAESLKLKPSR